MQNGKKMLISKTLHSRTKTFLDDYLEKRKTRGITQALKQGTRETLKAYRVVKENKRTTTKSSSGQGGKNNKKPIKGKHVHEKVTPESLLNAVQPQHQTNT
jgi:hypothetical protein